MWCSDCQQDVPAMANPENGDLCCAQCRRELRHRISAPWENSEGLLPASSPTPKQSDGGDLACSAAEEQPVPSWAFVERPPVDVQAWRWDEDLAEAERLVRTLAAKRTGQNSLRGIPSTAETRPTREGSSKESAAERTRRSPSPRGAKNGWSSWLAISLGVMSFVFGGVLLGWSFWTSRQELWSIGLPFALGGQAALIIGLVLQLDGLWQTHRDATSALDQLDEQVEELRQATNLLSTTHSTPAQSFYFHMAEGASPHMLLSDLKGQLDLLAVRLGKSE